MRAGGWGGWAGGRAGGRAAHRTRYLYLIPFIPALVLGPIPLNNPDSSQQPTPNTQQPNNPDSFQGSRPLLARTDRQVRRRGLAGGAGHEEQWCAHRAGRVDDGDGGVGVSVRGRRGRRGGGGRPVPCRRLGHAGLAGRQDALAERRPVLRHHPAHGEKKKGASALVSSVRSTPSA